MIIIPEFTFVTTTECAAMDSLVFFKKTVAQNYYFFYQNSTVLIVIYLPVNVVYGLPDMLSNKFVLQI